ncbi:MAG: hypothetical protein EOM70_13840 [Clostridia bacterium]|nr:hypothetical protein [Clostridia bacterium]
MSNIEEYLYIDYENVQDVQVEVIKKSVKVAIIVGQDQSKVPIDLVQKTQPYGSAVEWIQVSGKGRNALDFFIAFFLGRDVAVDRSKSFIIYSKDTGYDPLINYLKKSGVKARRIVSFQELDQNTPIQIDEAGVRKVRDSLGKLAANKRPKKRSSLQGFIVDLLKSATKQDIEAIVEDLFIKKLVYEENGIIKYALD